MKSNFTIPGIVGLFLVIFAAGYYLYSSNLSEEFAKKKECAQYQGVADKNAEARSKDTNQHESEAYVIKVFYSPLKNSCLYALRSVFRIKGSDGNWPEFNHSATIYDALTGEEVWQYEGPAYTADEIKADTGPDVELEDQIHGLE